MDNNPDSTYKQTETGLLPKKALSHLLEEIELPNMIVSVESNFERVRKAHDSIHEFIYLAPLCLPSTAKVSWHQKSAFLTYHWEAFHSAHRSLLEALAGYYNSAFTLLRLTLELIIKGAFFECLAHKEFRDKSEVLDKDKKGKNLKDTINSVIGGRAEIEETSAIIHDMLMAEVDGKVFAEQPEFRPNMMTVIKQLSKWGILEPVNNFETLYNIYKILSADVHVIPDKTDIGRRLFSQKELFEVDIMPEKLNKFIGILHKVMDIGIVIELNILSDWISQDEEAKSRLKERLEVVKDLELKFSSEKIKGLVNQ